MSTLKLAAMAILLASGAATAQDVEKKTEIKMMVADGSGEASTVHWPSDDMDFDIQDLAVGETRTIESESGRSVTITRAEEGFNFDVDGRTVTMPDMGAHGTHMAFVGDSAIHEEIDINVDADVRVVKAHQPEGVTIVSGKPLEQSVQDSIRSVLISAGNDEEVTFIDGSADGSRIMVKKIEIHDQ